MAAISPEVHLVKPDITSFAPEKVLCARSDRVFTRTNREIDRRQSAGRSPRRAASGGAARIVATRRRALSAIHSGDGWPSPGSE
jgi:hypothetical protein